jgi:transketolase
MGQEYRDEVLPPSITARVAIEAGVPFGWERYVGSQGAIIALNRFGASAPYKTLYRELGITAEAMVEAALSMIE